MDEGFLTPQQLAAAERTYLYALMANNAYADGGQYEIPGWTRLARYESTSGLGLDEYKRDGADPLEIVVAFRGTNFTSLKDWKTNVALIEPWQHSEAHSHVSKLREAHPDARITVTGHSLGGAIALNMSYRFDGLPAYAFNSSPRAFFAAEGKDNLRVLVWETGEALNVIRKPWLAARMQDGERLNFNFADYNWHNSLKPIAEHGMYGLSRGLLISAMANGNAHARQVFAANIRETRAMSNVLEDCAPRCMAP
ncbi:MAG: lipase family protein [Lysobacter sp.]